MKIKVQGNEKLHVTIMPLIRADGVKYPLLIIFKGGKSGPIRREIEKFLL